jgi:S-formylglutathione hydrolase
MSDGWKRVEIAGRPADVFEPPAPVPFALLFLHDVDGVTPSADPAITALLRKHHLPCTAPVVGSTWWVDRVSPRFDADLTPERFLLDRVVPWIQAQWSLGPRGIGVAGVGMGGQGAVRLGLKYPDRFPVVASLNGAFDFHEWHGRGTALDEMYESRERARQDTAVLQLDPGRWPPHIWFACDPGSEWHRGNDRLHEKLTAYGVPHTAALDTPASPAMMVDFVANGLARESRRLM